MELAYQIHTLSCNHRDFSIAVGCTEKKTKKQKTSALSPWHRRNKVSRYESQGLLPQVGQAVLATCSCTSQQLRVILHIPCHQLDSLHLPHDIRHGWALAASMVQGLALKNQSRLEADLGESGVQGVMALIPLKFLLDTSED